MSKKKRNIDREKHKLVNTKIENENFSLIMKDALFTLIINLMEQNKEDIFKKLLSINKDKFDINFTSTKGFTLLFMAIGFEKPNFLKLLLELKADPNIANSNNNDSLINTAIIGKKYHYEMCEMLINAGGDIEKYNSKDHLTPLAVAVLMNKTNIIKLLLKHKANVNVINKSQDSVLSLAIDEGNYEIIKLLIEYKADVNSINDQNQTPLEKAILLECEKITVEKDGNIAQYINKIDNQNELKGQSIKIIRLLLEEEADADRIDELGTSVYDLAYHSKVPLLAELISQYSLNSIDY